MTYPNALASQVYVIFIRATPDAIWEAITDPSFTIRYFHGVHVENTPAFHVVRGPGGADWGDGETLEWDPPRRLAHEWRSRYDAACATEPASRVTWEIEPREDGVCLLRVTHDRLDDAPTTARKVAGAGWMFVLSGLKTLLETRAPMTGPAA